MGDQDDGLAFIPQAAQNPKQMAGFGWGQYPCRFVENEDIGLPVQRLQNFHALLISDREFLDDRIGINTEFIFTGKPGQQ